jgi:ribosomal protein L16/L10AE
MGLDEDYHVFAAILESNGVSPHQVLRDAKIDCFQHDDAGSALSRAAAKFPEDASTDDSFQ